MAPSSPYRKAVFVLLFACLPQVSGVLQRQGRLGPQLKTASRGETTCVPLIDRTSYMAVPVGVGTPPQQVELIVDSGSSNVLVVRCGSSAGIRGAGCYEPGESTTHADGPNTRILSTYGKGKVTSMVRSDVVRVAGAVASPLGSLYEASSFDDIGPKDFQGILGLGPHPAPKDAHEWSQLFMEEAGVVTYALCFAPNAKAMWVNPSMPNSPAISSLPGSHWLLNMPGVSAGDVKSSLCTEAAPCTVVPDSGTTGIAVPEGHMDDVLSTLCDAWPRCAAEGAAGTSIGEKAKNFFSLLYGCQEWLAASSLDELPPLSFVVGGSDGNSQTLTLTPWAYVEERVATGHAAAGAAPGGGDGGGGGWGGMFAQYDFPGRAHFGAPGSKVCWPSFMEWSPPASFENGWILGTSLFYEYAVHFDISTNPPSMAFDAGDCGGCGGAQQANLRSSSSDTGGLGRRPLRRLDRPPRVFGREIVLPPV